MYDNILLFFNIYFVYFLTVYRLEEYCMKFLRKIVQSQNINMLPLPQPILDEILQTVL